MGARVGLDRPRPTPDAAPKPACRSRRAVGSPRGSVGCPARDRRWMPQPQINGSSTTRIYLPSGCPLTSADGSTPVVEKPLSFGLRLAGSLGTHARPRLLSVLASDPDNGDDVFTDGDIITFTFDMPTYIGTQGLGASSDPYRPDADGTGLQYDTDAVNALFEFNYYRPSESDSRVPSFGREYHGLWTDASTFVVTIVNSQRRVGFDDLGRVWNRMPRIAEESYTGNDFTYTEADSIWVKVLGDVRSVGRQSPRCQDRAPLRGNWGERQQRPLLVSVVGNDPDNGVLALTRSRSVDSAAARRSLPAPALVLGLVSPSEVAVPPHDRSTPPHWRPQATICRAPATPSRSPSTGGRQRGARRGRSHPSRALRPMRTFTFGSTRSSVRPRSILTRACPIGAPLPVEAP